MISIWWFYLSVTVMLVFLIAYGRMCYKQGIWDGAFNHFLPHVRREMLYYDKHRAEIIFKKERI